MKRQLSPQNNRILTEVELEFMTIVWRLGGATVKEVMKQLSEDRNLAYSSAATVMKILNQKSYLKFQRDSFAHTFIANISKGEYEIRIWNTVTYVFDDEPVALVLRLLRASQIQKDEILQIEAVFKIIS